MKNLNGNLPATSNKQDRGRALRKKRRRSPCTPSSSEFSSVNRVPLCWALSVVLLLLLELVLHDAKLLRFSHIIPLHPLLRPSHSPLAQASPEPVCDNPQAFPTAAPTSVPLTMGLTSETTRIVQEFEYNNLDLNKGVTEFLRQLDEGLEKDGTSLSQIPTYVTGVPNGTEKGLYLAVDLGGTNFRVCSVQLNGDTTFNLTYNKVAIPRELMTAKTAQQLFAFLAKQIDEFLREHHGEHFANRPRRRFTFSENAGFKDEEIFRLGFTFSFPVQQIGINKGILMRWTKGFDIPDAIGKDVCELLQTEIDKLGLPVKVAALVNDTVGTLMARSYTSPGKQGAILGAIFGTGTNGAYTEKLSKIKKQIPGQFDDTTGDMVINTEWGSFDNQLGVLPNTTWDIALDQESNNPGIQMFEKRVSGMFLGEILRRTIVDMLKNEETQLFKDVNSSSNDWKSTTTVASNSAIWSQWGIDTAIMSVAAADNTPDLGTLRQALEGQLLVYSPSLEDAQAFKAVAEAIGRRAARLSALAVAGIVLKTGKLDDPAWDGEPIDIGVDGSLVEHYPYFRDMMYEAFKTIDGIGEKGADKIRIGIAKDGSGVGAALIALVATAMEKNQPTPDVMERQRTSVFSLQRIRWQLRSVPLWQWAGVGLVGALVVNRKRDYFAALWRQYVA